MLKAASSRKADHVDLVIAIALAALGAAAVAVPDVVLRVTPPCLISSLVDGLCWGCGITHAVLALLHGDIARAWAYNSLAVLVLPLLVWLYLQHLRMIWRSYMPR